MNPKNTIKKNIKRRSSIVNEDIKFYKNIQNYKTNAKIILDENEIRGIIERFSAFSKIPVEEGFFKTAGTTIHILHFKIECKSFIFF